MNKKDKEQLREIATILMAVEHKLFIVKHMINDGQTIVCSTYVEQSLDQVHRIKKRLEDLW